ncbi:uncharacterized protein LOC119778540 [Cyprinodon tularosa]|uniref:uncharacterized protein LOC119778540 n=1 Tax=Cyprinodon tularosa TaxID=77115 RepID=UPI0018E1F24B|nr:uncharacterized protein LOC119778540 [Cyprinodon tularosa]
MQNGLRPRKGNKVETKEASQQSESQEMEGGASAAAAEATDEEEPREPTLHDIAGILRAFMGQQEVREKKQREVSAQQEQRFRSLQHQFRLLQMEIQARTTPPPEPTSTDSPPVTTQIDQIQATSQPEDSAFSSTGQSVHLPHPKLEKLTAEDDVEHFLTTFERIAAAYRWPQSDWVFHLIPLLTGKARCAYVNMDVDDSLEYGKVWIKEHNPKSAAEAATLADVFVAARSRSQPWSNSAWRAAKDSRRLQPYQPHQKLATGGGKPFLRENQPSKAGKRPPVCYLCGQEGHTKPMCPKNQSKLTQVCFVPHQNVDVKLEIKQSSKIITVKIAGHEINALIDTGSTQTLVHKNHVPTNCICPSETISVRCVHGDEKSYPTADMFVEVQGAPYLLKVGVADNLPYPVVLGEDLPVIYDLLRDVQSCNVAVTRAQAKNQDEHFATLSALPFFEAELQTEPGKSRKPRSQRRREKFQHALGETSVEVAPDMPLGFSIPTNIRQMQQNDPTLFALLLKARREASVGSDTNKEQYILQDGILYQHGQLKQLVVPKEARETVYKLLGIRSMRTTPYHPQTDGLTERFNQTLKQMLRKFVNDTGSDWDQWLPYLLFAYREVPQASTGFSPFELLYGHDVRGPLTLLRDAWEGDQSKEDPVNIISFVLHMRDKLQQMSELAQSHMAAAQKHQKVWFDKKARHRSFAPGQKVLVMLPTSDSKLLAKWQGPFEVLRKTGPTTYQVSTPGLQRGSRVLHVNLLKEWVPRKENESEVLLIHRVEEEEEVNDYLPSVTSSVLDLSHLTSEQQSQHCFKTRCCHKAYELQDTRTLPGGAEGGDGPHAVSRNHPTFNKYLNSISKFDSYPMPRIDDLIEHLGAARYLTTIDLSKGYWQVPLTKQSQELTAFRTPWGLFEFTVLPFGLHGAPATFQRLMDQVLSGLSAFTCAYLDDFVVFSATWEEHVHHLKEVLDRLRLAGLTINPAKCALARTEIQYLGYTIGGGTLKPQVDKINAIASCPLPQTRKQLRSFLGMAAFYHRFIPNFSARAAFLTDMTGSRSPTKIQWTAEAIAAFKDISQSLSKNPVLH